MLLLWISTSSLSIYITASRHVIGDSELLNYLGVLIVLGVVTVAFSYIHLKFLSPISTVRESMEELIDEEEIEQEE